MTFGVSGGRYQDDTGQDLCLTGVEVDEEGEPTLEPEQPGELETVLRVVIEPGPARAFARRCTKVVAAGRPPCPFCGGPLDPTGHICPRANGYKR